MRSAQSKINLLPYACILAAMFLLHGLQVWRSLQSKVAAQNVATQNVLQLKQQLSALHASRLQWTQRYPSQNSVPDLRTLLAMINLNQHGIDTDSDNVVVAKLEPVKQGELALGLNKICLASAIGDGGNLSVRAASYQTLLNGITSLAQRPDVVIGYVSLQADPQADQEGKHALPVAKLGDFCVYLRQE